jgi:large subunit ribosomal protein L9
MKVILLQDVAGQGKKGDLLNVSDGYARNYLLPRRLASPATPSALREHESKERAKLSAAEHRVTAARQAAEKLSQCHVIVHAKAGAGGRLFGAVTSAEVAAALREQFGVEVDKKSIVLPEPIKHHGLHTLKVKLGHEISASVTVEVLPPDGK